MLTWRQVALAVLSGTCWFLSCSPFDLWLLAWIAMVPTLVLATRAATTRHAFCLAWIAGTVGNGGGFYWFVGLLVRFGHMPWLVGVALWLMLAAYQGLVFAAFGAITHLIRQRMPLPTALVAPIVMVTCEFLLPVPFPFSVAITQAWHPQVIQVADLGGMPAVVLLLLMVNGAIIDVLLERPRRMLPGIGAVTILCASVFYGTMRIREVTQRRASAPHMQVGVVQPNLAFTMKGPDRLQRAARQRADLAAVSARLEAEGVDLLVWPETAFPYALDRGARRDDDVARPYRVRPDSSFAAPVLFGAISIDRTVPDSIKRWNSAYLLTRDGRIAGRYDKMRRVPISEYVPGHNRFSWIDHLSQGISAHFEPGRAMTTFDLRAPDGQFWKIGPLICYDDILEDLGRTVGTLHPNLLVNITNDSWFGDTSEPWQHLALSVYRAVETRTDLVRAVNTGVSAFVDATGHVYAESYAVDPSLTPRAPDGLRAAVALLDGGHTAFVRFGYRLPWLCIALTLLMLRAPVPKRWRTAAP